VLKKDRTYKGNWIRSLLKEGLSYEIVVLEEGVNDLGWREQVWIAYARGLEWRLTNATDGGEGGLLGYKFTKLHRMKISMANKGRRLTKLQRMKISMAARGRRLSPKHKSRLRSSWKGRHHTDAAKKGIGLGQAGKVMSEKGKESIRQANSKPIRERTTGMTFSSQKQAADDLGLCLRSVNRVLRGDLNQTHGYVFEYCDA